MAHDYIRTGESRDLSSTAKEGKKFLPHYKHIKVTITGVDADQVIFNLPAYCIAKCVAVIQTALNGTTPTADIGIAADEDLYVDQTDWDETAVGENKVFNIVSGASAIPITIDTTSGAADLTAGCIYLLVEYWDYSEMIGLFDAEVIAA